jgi:hypothetical protein
MDRRNPVTPLAHANPGHAVPYWFEAGGGPELPVRQLPASAGASEPIRRARAGPRTFDSGTRSGVRGGASERRSRSTRRSTMCGGNWCGRRGESGENEAPVGV